MPHGGAKLLHVVTEGICKLSGAESPYCYFYFNQQMISEQRFKAPCPPQPEPFLLAGSSLLANEYLLDAKQKSLTRSGREAVFLAKFTSPVLGVSLANKGTRSTAFL